MSSWQLRSSWLLLGRTNWYTVPPCSVKLVRYNTPFLKQKETLYLQNSINSADESEGNFRLPSTSKSIRIDRIQSSPWSFPQPNITTRIQIRNNLVETNGIYTSGDTSDICSIAAKLHWLTSTDLCSVIRDSASASMFNLLGLYWISKS